MPKDCLIAHILINFSQLIKSLIFLFPIFAANIPEAVYKEIVFLKETFQQIAFKKSTLGKEG